MLLFVDKYSLRHNYSFIDQLEARRAIQPPQEVRVDYKETAQKIVFL